MHITDVKGSCRSHVGTDGRGGDGDGDGCEMYNNYGHGGDGNGDGDGDNSNRRIGDSNYFIECATSDPMSTECVTITSWPAKWPPLRDCRGGVRVERATNLTAQRFTRDIAPASIPFIIPGAAAM